jgi:peroxin-3
LPFVLELNGRLKSHFSTLLSTLSFTLYALLPTLSPQLDSAYPVELTSQALQGFSNPVSSQISTASAENDTEGDHTTVVPVTLDTSVPDMPQIPEDERRGSSSSGLEEGSVSESWASEFRGAPAQSGVSDSFLTDTDDAVGDPPALLCLSNLTAFICDISAYLVTDY